MPRNFNPLASGNRGKVNGKKASAVIKRKGAMQDKTSKKRKVKNAATKSHGESQFFKALASTETVRISTSSGLNAEQIAKFFIDNSMVSRAVFARIASTYPEFIEEWKKVTRLSQLTMKYQSDEDIDFGDTELTEDEEEETGDVEMQPAKSEPKRPEAGKAKKEKKQETPEKLLNIAFVKKYIKKTPFSPEDSYSRMSRFNLKKTIPARFYAYAAVAESFELAKTKYVASEVVFDTTLMKKNTFWEYRWLMYLWVMAPLECNRLIDAEENPMLLKKKEKEKVAKAIKAWKGKSTRRKKTSSEKLFERVFPDFKDSKVY